MKNTLLYFVMTLAFLVSPNANFAQAPNLGTAANFVLFTSDGGVSNTGTSHLTGNVGTNNGSVSGFGNVNGVMHNSNGATAAAAADLLTAYNQLNGTTPQFFPASVLGNGQTLTAGVYSISGAASLSQTLTLNAQGNSGAVFIFKIQGAFSSGASSQIVLSNGAQACNVYWKIEGLVELATSTTMKGTIVANNGAITLNTGVTLDGRALSTTGAITTSGVSAKIPSGCGSAMLNGPSAPALSSVACYAIFSGNGPVTNSGVTNVTGDIGTNVGLTTGYNPLTVNGTIHPIPDASTAAAAADLGNVYTYLNTLTTDIELLYPAQFGNNLVLTPHTYLLNAATTFTDTLTLNAEGNSNAVFVIKINGALSTSTYATVLLTNGTQAKNVFWKVDGAVNINDYSKIAGTIVANNGAVSLNTGVILNGRALTTDGAVSTASITATMPPGCTTGSSNAPVITTEPIPQTACAGSPATFTVTATGNALTYQWRKGNVNVINGGNISGATTATLTIAAVTTADAASNYNVIVSGSVSPKDTSNSVALIVNTAPIVSSEPVNQTVCIDNPASFSVTATGTALTYQWRKGTVNLNDGGNLSGSTTATLTFDKVKEEDAAADYNVIITGTCTPADTSALASLVINSAPVITGQPLKQGTTPGGSASFTVTATGTSLTYQWRKGTVILTDGGNISGATTATLTINPANIPDNAPDYNVVVSGTCAPEVTSRNVALKVTSDPVITSQPSNQEVCEGSQASFSITASGTGIQYQWRKGSVNLTDGGNISGANTATLTINPVSNADASSEYNVFISSSVPNDTSDNVSLTVNTAPLITSQPINQIVMAGNSASFTINATGAGLIYQWRKGSVNLTNNGNISGTNFKTLRINSVSAQDAASDYNVVITGTCAPSVTSANASLQLGATDVASADENGGSIITFYPAPWTSSTVITINDASETNSSSLKMYNVLGEMVMNLTITNRTTPVNTTLPTGVYFYHVISKTGRIQSGKLISQ